MVRSEAVVALPMHEEVGVHVDARSPAAQGWAARTHRPKQGPQTFAEWTAQPAAEAKGCSFRLAPRHEQTTLSALSRRVLCGFVEKQRVDGTVAAVAGHRRDDVNASAGHEDDGKAATA